MPQKRGHGEGTVRYNEARGYWEARFTYSDPQTGQKKRKKFTGAKQGEALKRGRQWLQDLDNGLLADANKVTLWEWLDRWLQDYAKPKVRIKSYDKYESCLRCYVKPYLGNIIITKIKSPDVQRLFNQLLLEGGKEKKISKDGLTKIEKTSLSSSTVRATRRYLSMALDQAVKVGLLVKNIVKDTNPPKLVKQEIKPLTEAQATLLLAIVNEEAEQAIDDKVLKESARIAILLALCTGMRLGEIFGLRWDCVDLEKGIIYVKRSLVTSSKGQIFQEPKTAKSRRKIPIPVNETNALQKYKKWQDEYKQYLGDKFDDNDLVITNHFGRVYDTSNFTSRTFKSLLKKAGIDNSFKFHDLRHTHATLLLLKGINPKVVQERLGHSTITMTLDTYSHLMPDMQNTAVSALEQIFTKQ